MKRAEFDLPEFVYRHSFQRRALRYRDGLKRGMDVALSLILIPIIFPLIAMLWLIVRRDGFAGFFGHERVGLNGEPFMCWKLRTMVPDAQTRLRLHLKSDQKAAREWAQTYKLKHDPRVTHIWRFLRSTSLDELPQIWNVLKGEMSLVGPRPVPQSELTEYAGFERAYFTFRPGVTGLWQVSGRGSARYAQRVQMDVDYLRRAGVMMDLRTLFRTVGVVFKRTGC